MQSVLVILAMTAGADARTADLSGNSPPIVVADLSGNAPHVWAPLPVRPAVTLAPVASTGTVCVGGSCASPVAFVQGIGATRALSGGGWRPFGGVFRRR